MGEMCRFGFVVFVDNIRSVDELYVTSCNKFELHGHKWHYVLKLGYGSQFGPFSVLFKLNTHTESLNRHKQSLLIPQHA